MKSNDRYTSAGNLAFWALVAISSAFALETFLDNK